MQHYTDWAADTAGNALSGVSVSVYTAGTASLATLYTDNGITTGSNPITSGADGNYDFYAANGRYDLVLTKTGYTFVAADTAGIALFDLAGYTSTKAAATGYTRLAPNFCIASSLTQSNWTATASLTAQFMDSNIPDGAYAVLRLHFKVLSNNAVALRTCNTLFYTDSGGGTQIAETKFGAYEHVGVAPGTVLAEGVDTVIVPVSNSGYIYATDNALEANGSAFIDKVSVLGYYD